ncbi:MAG: DUF1684 domain-containing protein [Acidobacteria bacterium]|nr:DUF1684 domain-containing protein [Acidobacteriota bacterium]
MSFVVRCFVFAAVVPLAAADTSDAAYQKSLAKWKAGRIVSLKRDWLPLAGLAWLKPGENTLGSDSSSRVLLPQSAPAHAGVFLLEGDQITVRVRDGVRVTSGGKPVRELKLVADDPGPETVLELGSLRIHVIKRYQRYGIRIKDLESPEIKKFSGLTYFAVGPGYRITGTFEPAPGKKVVIPDVTGDVNEVEVPGVVRFRLHGREFTLTPLPSDNGRLFFILEDQTKDRETYPAGRYLYADPPVDGKVVLDFNRAYNPPCAFTAYATCPLPPKENRLPVRIEAGEKYAH